MPSAFLIASIISTAPTPTPNLPHMKLILALLAGLGLALYILALADGPSLLDIIDRF